MSIKLEKTRFSFTRSELITLTVLAIIFISGLIFQQIRRNAEQEMSEITILGVDTLSSEEVETLLREPGISETSDSSSLDQTGLNSLTSTAKPLLEGEGQNGGSNSVLTEPSLITDNQSQDFSDKDVDGSKASKNKLVHLNSASQNELETLPGIGPVLAGRILDWRAKNDRFIRVEDLLLIRGIGKKRFAILKPLVTVEP